MRDVGSADGLRVVIDVGESTQTPGWLEGATGSFNGSCPEGERQREITKDLEAALPQGSGCVQIHDGSCFAMRISSPARSWVSHVCISKRSG